MIQPLAVFRRVAVDAIIADGVLAATVDVSVAASGLVDDSPKIHIEVRMYVFPSDVIVASYWS